MASPRGIFRACGHPGNPGDLAFLKRSRKKKPVLCRGHYQSEKEAAEQLARFSRTYSNLAQWKERAKTIREGIVRGAGLNLKIGKPPLHPIVREERKHEGYCVANVAFESLPDFYSTGNIYRPISSKRLRATRGGAVSPRPFSRPKRGAGVFAKTCKNGARPWPAWAPSFSPTIWVGWGESRQYPHNGPLVLSLQLWNSIRAVDLLCSLDEVDSGRIGVTGASGGATQTFQGGKSPRPAIRD